MLNRFLDYIRKEHLIASGQQVLLAVSGGRDSVAMASLMARSGYPFAIAHCNFHLRPGDCDRDEAFVRALAERLGVRCFVAQFDTLALVRSERLSVEEAARNLRYAFFDEVMDREGFDCVATAHHRDDAVETFFINLLRGAGIGGLHGILPRNGRVVRPMLCFCRDEIDAYVKSQKLDFVEDVTNAEPLYLRNRIRLQLLPLLRSLSPSFDATMQGNLEHLREADALYRQAVDRACKEVLIHEGDGFHLDITALQKQTAPATILFELLRPFGFSSAMMPQIVDSLDGQSGAVFLSPTHRLLKDRQSLLLLPLDGDSDGDASFELQPQCRSIEHPLPMRFDCLPVGECRLKVPPQKACFDYDRLRFPLHLRRWRMGDRFRPFGMRGSRLVSDLLVDAKLSREAKKKVWLLCDADDRILWVVGLRAASVASVDGSTCRVFTAAISNS